MGRLSQFTGADVAGDVEWWLEREDGTTFTLRHAPRLTCGDFTALCDAAADGLGVAFLPDHACAEHIASGRLVRIHRDWRSQAGIVHLVFTTRRGLPPAVRVLLDHLASAFPKL